MIYHLKNERQVFSLKEIGNILAQKGWNSLGPGGAMRGKHTLAARR